MNRVNRYEILDDDAPAPLLHFNDVPLPTRSETPPIVLPATGGDARNVENVFGTVVGTVVMVLFFVPTLILLLLGCYHWFIAPVPGLIEYVQEAQDEPDYWEAYPNL